jgi:phosphoserine phosphatase RsbU/P
VVAADVTALVNDRDTVCRELTREQAARNRIVELLQQALLDIPERIRRLRFSHLYRPATQGSAVGGDFYDVFELKDGHVAILIGDVSGHGVEAARLATLVKDTIRAFTYESQRPAIVLSKTNRVLVERAVPGFITVFLVLFEPTTHSLTYCSAGHPDALLLRESGEVVTLGGNSLPLGFFSDWAPMPRRLDMQEHDRLLLYTDGLTEARRDGELFGEKRLIEAVKRQASQPPDYLPQALVEEVLAFSGGALRDDVAILTASLESGLAAVCREDDEEEDTEVVA